jgi:hypothetical protein
MKATFRVGCLLGILALAAAACGGKRSDAPCTDVVAKMMANDKKAGDAEKKFFTKWCESMEPKERGCIADSKNEAEMKACVGDKKLK